MTVTPIPVATPQTFEEFINEAQTVGYIMLDGNKIKVLIRQTKYGRSLKMRKSGKDGSHFTDEENMLNQNKIEDFFAQDNPKVWVETINQKRKNLLDGKTIEI